MKKRWQVIRYKSASSINFGILKYILKFYAKIQGFFILGKLTTYFTIKISYSNTLYIYIKNIILIVYKNSNFY